MLDVNEYLERTLEVKLSDKVLHVYEPTHNLYLAALQHEETDNGTTFISYQLDVLTSMLNRNKEGVKLSTKNLEELPRSFIVALYRDLMMMCNKAVTDPN